jgi:hypothetical protein
MNIRVHTVVRPLLFRISDPLAHVISPSQTRLRPNESSNMRDAWSCGNTPRLNDACPSSGRCGSLTLGRMLLLSRFVNTPSFATLGSHFFIFTQELQADAIRQARVKYNVAMIQAREAEAHMPRLNEPELARPAMTEPAMTEPSPTRRYQVGSFASTPTPQPEARFTPERLAPETTARANTEEPSKPSPWEAADKLVESQAWTPAVGRRRG